MTIRSGVKAISLIVAAVCLAAACKDASPLPRDFLTDPAKYCSEGAPVCQDFLHDPGQFCVEDAPACQSAIATAVEAVHPHRPDEEIVREKMRQTLLADPTTQELIAGRTLGVDYWLDITPWAENLHGEDGGWATLVLATPASFEGEITVATEPCRGHSVDDKEVDPDDPCLDKPRKFAKKNRSIIDAQVVMSSVDVTGGRVFNIHKDPESPEAVQQYIDYLKSTQE